MTKLFAPQTVRGFRKQTVNIMSSNEKKRAN